jgi:hypothetical protein
MHHESPAQAHRPRDAACTRIVIRRTWPRSRESVVRELLESAQAAGCGLHRSSDSADLAASRESVVRELLGSAQAAGRGLHRSSDSADLAASRESVVREL